MSRPKTVVGIISQIVRAALEKKVQLNIAPTDNTIEIVVDSQDFQKLASRSPIIRKLKKEGIWCSFKGSDHIIRLSLAERNPVVMLELRVLQKTKW
jgi:hypothetical protein